LANVWPCNWVLKRPIGVAQSLSTLYHWSEGQTQLRCLANFRSTSMRVFSDLSFCLVFTLVFRCKKCFSGNRLMFSCLADFFVWLLKTRVEYDFRSSSPLKGTVTRSEYKTWETLVKFMSKNSISGLFSCVSSVSTVNLKSYRGSQYLYVSRTPCPSKHPSNYFIFIYTFYGVQNCRQLQRNTNAAPL
jgi:hypothetical protein